MQDAESPPKKKKIENYFIPRVFLTKKDGRSVHYRLGKKLGSGGYGDIYEGVEETDWHKVAIKLGTEHGKKMLQREAKAYELFDKGYVGIPQVEAHGVYGDCYVMVMEVLGQSLQDLLTEYHYSVKAVVNIAIQSPDPNQINHLEYIHSKNHIHGDIKPSNILVGVGERKNNVYIIDFGLAKEFCTAKTRKHIPWSNKNGFHGTPRYASIHAHQGIAPSRRDDLESLGYVLIYLLRGSLPWQSVPGGAHESKKQRRQRITDTKVSMSLDELCSGMAEEFATYMRMIRALKFPEDPPYAKLRDLFVNLRARLFGGDTEWMSTLQRRDVPLRDDTNDQVNPPPGRQKFAPYTPAPAPRPAVPSLQPAHALPAPAVNRPVPKMFVQTPKPAAPAAPVSVDPSPAKPPVVVGSPVAKPAPPAAPKAKAAAASRTKKRKVADPAAAPVVIVIDSSSDNLPAAPAPSAPAPAPTLAAPRPVALSSAPPTSSAPGAAPSSGVTAPLPSVDARPAAPVGSAAVASAAAVPLPAPSPARKKPATRKRTRANA